MLIDGSRLVQIKIGEGDVDDAVRLSKIHPLDGRTLGDRAYAQISELLIAGILAPGDKLSLRATADLLGVSMMPVREAVTRMVADRALEVAPNRAIRVPVMSAVQFRDLTNVRIMIEGHAASEAARLASPEDLARVARAELAFRNQRSLAKPDLGLAVKLNQAFHFALYKAAHSAVLLDIIRALWLKAGPVINLDLRANPERFATTQAVQFHADAMKAVTSGKVKQAREAITADIRGAADYILSQGRLVEGD